MKPEDPNDEPAKSDDEAGNEGFAGDATEETIQWGASEESTVEIPAQNEASRVSKGSGSSKQPDNDPNEETAGPEEFGKQSESFHPFGIGTKGDRPEQTVDNIDATFDMRTVQLRPQSHQTHVDSQKNQRESVMQSADVSQTIDPRELSKEDAAYWGSAAIGASKANTADQTNLPPAVERSFAESKLQIRERDLAVPTRDPNLPSDFRLVRLLGRGGMGNVYVAKQASLDRMIAVKVIRPLSKSKRQALSESGRLDEVEHDRRQQFLSEAVVTGDLDHPNIVPIHDIAVAADNTLFYAMKRVIGQPWLKTINDRTRDENLEILLKACDAIGFAHTRGVIHRDIKPENIMLGDFGEVLVMDWGLALAKPEFEKKDSITATAGLGGTPAFMAPEMAIGPVDSIGTHSDIYLLGATLFYIIVGHAPHKADNISQCIRAVASNTIREAPEECKGELLDIALRAMETDPKDRYVNVKAFQQAIREYRSHSESVAISIAAESNHLNAVENAQYDLFSRAAHGFEQSIALWKGNQAAIDGLAKCKIDYASAAYQNGDYDLGLSLLDSGDPSHVTLIEKLKDGIAQRELRAGRLILFRRLAVASLLIILIGGSVALYVINKEKSEVENQRGIAVMQRDEATRQKGLADIATEQAVAAKELAHQKETEATIAKDEAVEQKKIATLNEDLAIEAQIAAEESAAKEKLQAELAKASEAKADLERGKAEYESYLSQIGLAKARIDENEFDDARRILTAVRNMHPERSPAWEWRYLWQQANQSQSLLGFDAGVIDLAADPSGEFVIAVCSDGTVHRANLIGGMLDASEATWTWQSGEATCVALRTDGELIAIGTRLGAVTLVDPATGKTVRQLSGHASQVTDAEFLPDGRLLTGSTDRTVALWDPNQKQRLAECWHIAPVLALAARQPDSDEAAVVIAAVSDAKSGRVAGWRLASDDFQSIGEFVSHDHPIVSVALSKDGTLAASGDTRGNVFLWSPEDLQQTDFEGAIKDAITRIREDTEQDAQMISSSSNSSPARDHWQAHPDAISAIAFDETGEMLLTGSDDYTIRAWKVSDHSSLYSLRGHGGWVRALALVFSAGEQHVLSGSVDGTLRSWIQPALDPVTLTTNRSTQSPERENQLHGDEILAARLDRSGTKLISASRDHTARILGIDRKTMSFRELARINTKDSSSNELNEGTEFLAMSTHLDQFGKRLFIGSADSTIRIWDVESGVQLGSLNGTGLNNAFALSSDGRRLLSGSSRVDAKAILWDVDRRLDQPRVLYRFGGHKQAVTAYAASSDGRLLVTGDRGGRILIWDGETGKQIEQPIDLFSGFRINELAIAPDDRSLWVASDTGQLTEIDLRTRVAGRRLDHDGFVTGFSLSPRGNQVVTLSSETSGDSFDTTALWWDLTTLERRPLDRIEAKLDDSGQSTGSNARINSVRFGNRGSYVVICRQGKGGRSGRVSIIQVADMETKSFELPDRIGAPETGFLSGRNQLITLNGEAAFRWSLDGMVHEKSYRPHAAVTNACFSPDGKIAATASRSVRLWNTETGEGIDKLENPHQGGIRSLDFSSRVDDSGYLFATTGDDASGARLWTWKDRETGFRLERELGIDGTTIEIVRFAPDGRHLMLAATSGAITIESLDDPASIFQWKLPSGLSATCAAFSADGRYLGIGASDKSAWLIDLEPGSTTKPRVMRGHADRIESICVLHDATDQIRVLTASRDKSARVWDPRLGIKSDESPESSDSFMNSVSGREVLALRRHTQGVTAIDCTADGNLVITAARDGRVLLWPSLKI